MLRCVRSVRARCVVHCWVRVVLVVLPVVLLVLVLAMGGVEVARGVERAPVGVSL